VALIGEITGVRTLPLGEIEYTYPVIAISEIHLWNKSDLYPFPGYYYYPYPYGWYGPPWYPYGPRYY
jgi:outer membrane lipoprotein